MGAVVLVDIVISLAKKMEDYSHYLDYVIQFAAWTYLPGIGAGFLQSILYMFGLKERQQQGT